MRMSCILTGLVEFALQILLGDFRVQHMCRTTCALLCAVARYVESLQ